MNENTTPESYNDGVELSLWGIVRILLQNTLAAYCRCACCGNRVSRRIPARYPDI